MPQATCNLVDIMFIPLDTPADMGNALDHALGIGYRGSVSAFAFNGAEHWRIELNGPGNAQPLIAGMGDVFVWREVSGFLSAMTKDAFNQTFTVAKSGIATPNPSDIEWFPLETASDFGAALDGFGRNGYSGKMFTEADHGSMVMRIELTGPGNPTGVTASAGDVLLWHNPPGLVEVVPRGRFMETYTPL